MRKFAITVNGQSYEVEVEEIGGAPVFAAAPAAAPVLKTISYYFGLDENGNPLPVV